MERLLSLNRKAPASAQKADIREIPLEQLRPNPTQPRQSFDDGTINELAESIRSRGVIQPLMVRPAGDEAECFEIVVGERRFVAAGRAGLSAVPCVVRSLDDRETFILSVAENVAREDLNPIDEAAAYRRILDEGYAAHQGEIAGFVGVHRTRVSRKLKLLELDARIQGHIREHPEAALSLTHLEELSRLPAGDEQHRLYEDAVDRGLSTREMRARVDAALAPPEAPRPAVSKSVVALEGGARVAIYPAKIMVRIPREPGDEVDLPRIVADLDRVVAELRARVHDDA